MKDLYSCYDHQAPCLFKVSGLPEPREKPLHPFRLFRRCGKMTGGRLSWEPGEAYGPKGSIGTVALQPCLYIYTYRLLGPTSGNTGETAGVSAEKLSYINGKT